MNKHELMLHSLDEQLQKMLYPQGRTIDVQPLSDYRESMGRVLLFSETLGNMTYGRPFKYGGELGPWEHVWGDEAVTFEAHWFCESPFVLPEGLD